MELVCAKEYSNMQGWYKDNRHPYITHAHIVTLQLHMSPCVCNVGMPVVLTTLACLKTF